MSEQKGDKKSREFVKWFSEIGKKDVGVAGGKGASLGEMYQNKFPVPPGFIITADAYALFIERSGIGCKIKEILDSTDVQDTEKLQNASKEIREIMEDASMPGEIENAILEAYEILDVDKQEIGKAKGSALEILRTGHEPPFVAVRSSATTEDLADASFAGQQESFLNVKGKRELLNKVKKCMSSLFTARAIYYRQKKGFDSMKAKLAVVVQKMVDSDKSGVIFSRNPVKHNDDNVIIEAVWGLGEGIVSGKIKPDSYSIKRNTDRLEIVEEKVSDKKIAIVRTSGGKNEIAKLTPDRSTQRVLSNYELKRLSLYAVQLEEHYGTPQDIEFAIEGDKIYIVQSRAVTTRAKEILASDEVYGEELLSGLGASPGICSGIVKIIHSTDELNKIKKGDVLVTEMTNPDMVVAMQCSAAIVTDEGGITSHAAIVSREMGIPAVVGTEEATRKLKDGQVVTIDGYKGKVYAGKSEKHLAEVEQIIHTKTKIKVIVDIPAAAQRAAKSGVKSIGLTRLEGIIAEAGKHPFAYKKQNKIKDYVELLVKGLGKIAEPFEEMWVRSSDLRSDEFSHLEGAPQEHEGNPMLGDHGIRFSLKHPEILKAELLALKELNDAHPHKKFGFMMPQVISVEEFKEAKRIARDEVGLSEKVRLGIMVETPAAVELINEFCNAGIQFVSFGTNDLTQYLLAIDRNNEEVQYLFDEMHPAVLMAISYVIRRCKKSGIETSICGQAGSKPEMAKFLVEQGIDSISVNADAAHKVSEIVSNIEQGKSVHIEDKSEHKRIYEASENVAPTMEGKTESNEEEAESKESEQIKDVEIDSETPGKDIEEAVLEALGDEKMPGNEEEVNEYQPGMEKESDTPSLIESTSISSELLNDIENYGN